MAGTRFPTRIWATSRMLRPMPTMSSPPTAVISATTAWLRKPAAHFAMREIVPWYTNTGSAEKTTPTPMVEEKTMAEMPSNIDFAKRVLWFPVRPPSKAPVTAIAPTQ